MIVRLTCIYLLIFAIVLAALSFAAYAFVAGQYHSLLLPALDTPEGAVAYARALHRVALTIVEFDVPLLIVVGIASATLARISITPLLQARERERTFIADAAHELRSPLATIATVAQAQQHETQAQKERDAFALIATTALEAGALIGDLLTLARSPKATLLSCEPLDVATIVRACVTEFEPRARASGIAIDASIEAAVVNGDARRLKELVRNLLENALKHARTQINVRAYGSDGRAVIQVADDGSGVQVADRERIFHRFVHGNDPTAGSGLGLAIARWVAHAHNGLLVLDDSGPGASFTAQIPLLQ